MNAPAQLPSPPLVSELSLGSARGGKRPQVPVSIEVVRELTAEDLPAIQAPPTVGGPLQTVNKLRHSHHRLAELIAKGTPGTEISLITGYSQSYISTIQRDPAMAELIAYYEAQKESIFVDGMERLRVIGVDATEALHDKLLDPTVEWTNRELMELVELAVVGPATPGKGQVGNSPAPSVQLEVKFVGARGAGSSGPVIDVTARDSTHDK